MLTLLYEYKKSLKTAKKMYNRFDNNHLTARDEKDKKIISSIIKDLEYTIHWLETGRNPDSRRGIDKKGVYLTEPLTLDRIKIQKPESEYKELPFYKKAMIDDILCELTEKERVSFMLIRVEGLTYEYTAELLGLKKGTIQNHLERAEKKINKRKKKLFFVAG